MELVPITQNYELLDVYVTPGLNLTPPTNLTLSLKPCVFLGYSLTQSAYYCLDPSSSKIYVSRHVKFVESSFPFTSLSNQSPRPQPKTITTWIPPPLRVSSGSLVPPLNTPSTVDSPQQPPCEAPSTSTQPNSSTVTSSCPIQSQTNSQPPVTPPPPTHSMTTRAKNNIHKPLKKNESSYPIIQSH